MPANESKTETPARSTAPAKQLRRFEAPKEIPAQFGLDTEAEDHLSGFVQTENVRPLLDAFGLHDRTSVVFPFQHMVRRHGEIWSMRIEPIAAHTVNGNPVMAHHWVYMRQFPENVGAAA